MSRILVHDRGIRRRACERCHKQKLACRRANNNENCLRCVRANVACVSGPLRPIYRATPSYMTEQQPIQPPSSAQTNIVSIDLSPYDAQLGEHADELFSRPSAGLLYTHSQLDANVNFTPEESLCESFASIQDPASPGLSTILGLHDGHQGFSPSMQGTQRSGDSILPRTGSLQTGNIIDSTATHLESHGNMPQDSSLEAWPVTSPVNAPDQGKSDLMTWIAKISQLNIELHKNLHAVPPIGVWQECWTNPVGPNAARLNEEKDLAIDRTLQFSQQYIEIMNHVFSYFHSAEKSIGNATTALSPLGDPPQLLVLSCYSCLIETYDKILQHVEACAKIRLEMDATIAEAHTPIGLPGLSIGTFEIAPSSSLKVVILLHIMEAMMARVQRLINEMTQSSDAENRGWSGDLTAANGNDSDLISITQVSLQGIRAKEKAIADLINTVRDLAIQCKIL